jgi:uncharacterized RDD family membrane protein YckC
MPEKIYAGFIIRLVATILDTIFLLPIALIFYFFGDAKETLSLGNLFSYLFSLAYVAYFLGGPYQATPGKRLLGIYVAKSNNEKLTKARAMARAGASLLSFAILGLGFITIIFTKEKVALHDFICNTRVFYGRKNQ